MTTTMRVAVIGHVEVVEFISVPHVPAAGAIVHGNVGVTVPAGGGAVAAVQLARWGADTTFFTALGDDPIGHHAESDLRAMGVTVRAVFRSEPQRRGVTLVDSNHERTIITIGKRLEPVGADALPWNELADFDAVYVTAADPDAVRLARRARVLVGTSRVLPIFRGIALDAIVGSANDPAEKYSPGDLDPAPKRAVRTEGDRGGHWMEDGATHRWAAIPATVTGDTYGAGDTFAAALTLGLGEGKDTRAAIEGAAKRAIEILAFTGPYPRRRVSSR